MNTRISRWLAVIAFAASAQILSARSATWNLNPTSNYWDTAANWTPATIPYGDAAVATFGVSNTSDIVVGDPPNGTDATTIVGGIVFSPGASSYVITIDPSYGTSFSPIIEFHGMGITNNSGIVQNLVAASSGTSADSSRIYFMNNSSAGENAVITNEGGNSADGGGAYGGFTQFGYGAGQEPNAGNATIINNGATASGTIYGGATVLLYSTNAENATFINNPGTVSGAAAGHTLVQVFPVGGNLGTSTFIANPANVPGAEGGWAEMDVGTCDGTRFIANGASVANCQAGQIYCYGAEYNTGNGIATFTGNGGNGGGAEGGLIDLFALPRSDQTIVIANGGTNGGLGGTILIENAPLLDLGQFQVFGNGVLDLTNATSTGITIGSLAGSGMVLLDSHSLIVGNNNLSTSFGGVIKESGLLVKSGTGTLTLSGASTYSGGTTVTAGTLRVNNQTGSATGPGAVKVNAGTLGGKGATQGAVTIGTGAFLAPSVGANQPATLSIRKALTFNADSTYTCKLNTNNARADQVIAKGVTIASGAQFSLQAVGNKKLTAGTVFTVVSNTATTAIGGTFANLADNSTLTAGRNNYQASYEGGDGNDLTLTVVQ